MEQTVADETFRTFTYMYGSQENHTVKVELGETSFVQYTLFEKPVFVVKSLNWPESSQFSDLFSRFHHLSPLIFEIVSFHVAKSKEIKFKIIKLQT